MQGDVKAVKAADLQKLISEGEGERLEFKAGSTSASTVAEIVCGFLNSVGGRLVLGVGDQGRIMGLNHAEAVIQELKLGLFHKISPAALWTAEIVAIENKQIILIEIPEGPDKPYLSSGSIYFRREGKVVPATRDDISHLISRRAESSLRWERKAASGADRASLNEKLILETLRLAVESQRWTGEANDTVGFLSSLGLIDNGVVTNAAVLLYGKEPTRILPQARVRLLVLPAGKTGDEYAVDRLFEGCLLETAVQIPEALSVFLGGVTSKFSDSWQREERQIYPAMALREGIMNALVHRDYALPGSITISVLPKSLQISNPGGLPAELKPADLKKNHPSLPRNPDVAHVCFLHRFIEKIGRGTQRIVEDFKSAHLSEPKWETGSAETRLTLSSPSGKAREIEELNARQQQILDALEKHKQLRPAELVKLVGGGVTERTVRSDIQALIDRGSVSRRGKGRGISYEVVGKP